MTAKKKSEPIEPSHEAETEKDVVGDAEPAQRLTIQQAAQDLAQADGAEAQGNRIIYTVLNETGLRQQFQATVEEILREF